MAAHVRVECDRCKKLSEDPSSTFLGARNKARLRGWVVRVAAGYDYCPDCKTPNDHSFSWRGHR